MTWVSARRSSVTSAIVSDRTCAKLRATALVKVGVDSDRFARRHTELERTEPRIKLQFEDRHSAGRQFLFELLDRIVATLKRCDEKCKGFCSARKIHVLRNSNIGASK
jgi:hypothetical protein